MTGHEKAIANVKSLYPGVKDEHFSLGSGNRGMKVVNHVSVRLPTQVHHYEYDKSSGNILSKKPIVFDWTNSLNNTKKAER